MSIDLSGLSAKQLGALIKNAKKQQTVVAKRTPIAKVRTQLTRAAKAHGYSIEELFGASASAGQVVRLPLPSRARAPAASWARCRRSIATRPIPRKPGPAVASSRAGWPN